MASRKQAHLDLCAEEDVEYRGSTLLEEVHLLHHALPERSLAQVDTAVDLFGRRWSAPIYIAGMTGGTERAGEINRALAAAAQKTGLALGLGSQRPMWTDPEVAASYRVRDVAPDVVLFGNLGAVQVRDVGTDAVVELAEAVRADAFCVHLNVAQELVQDEGDRDFRGCLNALAELVDRLAVPVIAKETGCGFSPPTLAALQETGVAWIDASGSGGTSWPGVEALRGSSRQAAMGGVLREWGIPTAASVLYARQAGYRTLASGGIRNAHDVARALALGAEAAGLALPFLRAYTRNGVAGVMSAAEELIEGLRSLCLLSGVARPADLVRAPRVIGPVLERWAAGPVDASAGEGA
ncbi:MAG: type 2 isopentenyl-diphosphate Delta-isomerase [Myxococcota bacterium]